MYIRLICIILFFFFSSRRRHTRCSRDWSSDVCSSDLRNQPRMPIKPPIFHPMGPKTTFPNIDISRDTFPQNEPSVRISHRDPNRVVAAWRDFRTGVNPAVRRVGWSLSTDGGATWGPTALLPKFYESAG